MSPRFVPETARRLADPLFTGALALNRPSLDRFVEKQEQLLGEVFAGLDIVSNQTPELLAKFKTLFSKDIASLNALSRVVLMTPENIHLNSFMYEPILDMSDEHLRKLYTG